MDFNKVRKIGLIFLVCTAASVVIQMAAPIILSIVISGTSLTVPFLFYHLVIEKGWRIKLVQTKAEEKDSNREKTEKAEMPQENSEMQQKEQEEGGSEEKREAVLFWYCEKGKTQMDCILEKLNSRGIYECWIRKDGICNIRTARGYRRAGIFTDYPGKESYIVAEFLRKEGLNAVDQGRYLYVSWAEE